MSTCHGFAVFSRLMALSKCRRPHFCREIAAGGGHLTPPTAAKRYTCQQQCICRCNTSAAAIHLPKKTPPATKKRWPRFRNHPLHSLRPRCQLAKMPLRPRCQFRIAHFSYCCVMPTVTSCRPFRLLALLGPVPFQEFRRWRILW